MDIKQTARTVAIKALAQVWENEGYSNIVIDKELKNSQLEPRDKALASAIFYGVLEKQITLDFYLKNCLKDPKKKINDLILIIIRTALYQIIFLDKIPDSAAVNEAVEMAKHLGKQDHSGFVNGVLRGFLRKREKITLPDGDDPESLSVLYSVPEELIRFWISSYGKECTLKLLSAFDERAEIYLRVNTLKVTPVQLEADLEKENIHCRKEGLPENIFAVSGSGALQELKAFEEGKFHVQDLSSQLICGFLGAKEGDTVCDCCAAPGGKSFTISQMTKNTGKLFSFDLYKGRVNLIKKGAQRLGITNIEADVHDALDRFTQFEYVDRMICDVPCSGFGVIRRKPEIRYKQLKTVAHLSQLQYDILFNASRFVKPGGILLYSTCTLNPKENGEVAEKFLKNAPDYEPVKLSLPDFISRTVSEPEHTLTMMPFSGSSDGFYVALFRRKDL